VTREAAKLALERHNYRVVAADGSHAADLLDSSHALVVITDMFMPDCDGIEVMKSVRARNPAVKVLAISGGSATLPMDPLRAAKLLGADATLKKPFHPDQLTETVDGLYDSAERERQQV
jgi:CheY-like chemotaxis protein